MQKGHASGVAYSPPAELYYTSSGDLGQTFQSRSSPK